MTYYKERQAARSRGQMFYIGVDCPYEHGGQRYVSTNDCVSCAKIRSSRAKQNFRRTRKGVAVPKADQKPGGEPEEHYVLEM